MAFNFCTLALIGLLAVATAGPASASDTAVIATVHQFVDSFNKGDVKTALATCATPASIVDEFPPHEWQGPTACADWVRDLDASNKRDGITHGVVTLGTPWHIDVTGDRAYVVVPASYTYMQHGKQGGEAGSIFVLALKKVAAGWRITGWAWARH